MTKYFNIAFLFVIIFFTSCSGLGEKVEESNVEVYYTKNVSKEDATKVASFLNKMVNTAGNVKQTTQLDKKDAAYILKMVVIENFEKDEQSVMTAKTISHKLSEEVFGGKAVRFWACHDGFVLQADLGSYYVFLGDLAKVLYSSNITKKEVEQLLKGLKEQKIINENDYIEFDKNDKTYQLKLNVPPDLREDEKHIKSLQELTKNMVNTYFAQKPFELHICNRYFGTKQVISIVSK